MLLLVFHLLTLVAANDNGAGTCIVLPDYANIPTASHPQTRNPNMGTVDPNTGFPLLAVIPGAATYIPGEGLPITFLSTGPISGVVGYAVEQGTANKIGEWFSNDGLTQSSWPACSDTQSFTHKDISFWGLSRDVFDLNWVVDAGDWASPPTQTGANTFDFALTRDGTVFWVLLDSAAPAPNFDQLRNGQDGAGNLGENADAIPLSPPTLSSTLTLNLPQEFNFKLYIGAAFDNPVAEVVWYILTGSRNAPAQQQFFRAAPGDNSLVIDPNEAITETGISNFSLVSGAVNQCEQGALAVCGVASAVCIDGVNQFTCQCPAGFSQNLPPNTPCEPCPEECDECTSEACTNCTNLFFINDQGTCTPCTLNCPSGEWLSALCNDTVDSTCSPCTQCANNTFISTPCGEADTVCTNCTTLDALCVQCNPEGCEVCQPGSRLNETNHCEPCDENCLTCDSTTCFACEDGFFVDSDGGCSACGDNCIRCIDVNNCTLCNSTSVLNNATGQCGVTCGDNCLDCDPVEGCRSCDERFVEDPTTGLCQPCPEHCDICENTTVCVVCDDGWKIQNGTCVVCRACQGCPNNTFILDDECHPCSNCTGGNITITPCGRDSDTICAPCPLGQFSNNGTCQPCTACRSNESVIVPCSSTSDTQCGGCPPGTYSPVGGGSSGTPPTSGNESSSYYPSGSGSSNPSYANPGSCVPCSTCPTGSTVVRPCSGNNDTVCSGTTSCPLSCQSCNYNSTCTQCADGFYASNGRCYSCDSTFANCASCRSYMCVSCRYGYRLSSDRRSCIRCNSYCAAGSYACGQCTTTTDVSCTQCSTTFPHCSACTATSCTTCVTGYYLSYGVCTPCSTCPNGIRTPCSITADTVCQGAPRCPSYCATCSYGTCTQCNSGYYLYNGQCRACTTCPAGAYTVRACCAAADTQCTTCTPHCSACGSYGCTACASGYYLRNGQCYACSSCTGSTYVSRECTATSDTQCTRCSTYCTGCSSCTRTGCTGCSTGQYMSYGQCYPCTLCRNGLVVRTPCSATADTVCGTPRCPAYCSTCNGYGQCTLCNNGYFLRNGACIACSSCASGYYAATACCSTADTVCVRRCPAYCNTCNNYGQCTLCQNGYFLRNGECVACSTCGTGYVVQSPCCPTADTQCVRRCPAYCSTCNSYGQCTVCNTGYYVRNGECAACSTCASGYIVQSPCSQNANTVCVSRPSCPAHCSTCNSYGQCTACNSGYYVRNGQCVACTSCATGYYPSYPCSGSSDTQCTRCCSNCLSCSSANCGTCADGYYLNGGRCSACSTCSSSQYEQYECSANSNTMCQSCTTIAANCATCTRDRCNSCQSGYTLDSRYRCVVSPYANCNSLTVDVRYRGYTSHVFDARIFDQNTCSSYTPSYVWSACASRGSVHASDGVARFSGLREGSYVVIVNVNGVYASDRISLSRCVAGASHINLG